MKQKIQTLLKQLNHGLVEREDTLKTALLTVLAGENLVLIGPPGTGKSLIARRIAESFAHSGDHGYFEYLLTKFSTPEEIFGPLSITELKADRFKRNTAGYLPTVKMAFLDEIFKASSSILNALLTILNERVYHNGSEPQAVPMQALIAASNELPNDQEELSALYDRFLVRRFVDYVSEDNLPRLFDNAGTMPALTGPTQLTTADLSRIKDNAQSVTLPDDIRQAMQRIWAQHKETFKEDRRESLSDRRLKKVIQLLCVSAATNGRSQVDLSDVFLLKDCLWNHQDNAIKVRDLILSTLRSFSRPVQQNGDLQPLALQNGLLTYEVAQDGKTLIPATPKTAVRDNVSTALAQSNARRNTVVKGFKGSGTEQDPLLIQTVEDLMDLSRPDVGLKGFYFRQTADIDCIGLSSWTDIPFKGHYDGGGHSIQGKPDTWHHLFSVIQTQSNITNLKLKRLYLAAYAVDSHITYCTGFLIQNQASNCTISACESMVSLFTGIATGCTISACQAGSVLIRGTATDCTIRDCLAVLNLSLVTEDKSESFGGIANELKQGNVIERCFVTGKIQKTVGYHVYFSGIAKGYSDNTIRHCALGKFELSGGCMQWRGRITDPRDTLTRENNAAIDTNPGNDNINGNDGKTVAAALFKQRYFENTLGWDFDTVWQWDDQEDRPTLRSVGVGSTSQQPKPVAQAANMTDLLTQQMRANLWL